MKFIVQWTSTDTADSPSDNVKSTESLLQGLRVLGSTEGDGASRASSSPVSTAGAGC